MVSARRRTPVDPIRRFRRRSGSAPGTTSTVHASRPAPGPRRRPRAATGARRRATVDRAARRAGVIRGCGRWSPVGSRRAHRRAARPARSAYTWTSARPSPGWPRGHEVERRAGTGRWRRRPSVARPVVHRRGRRRSTRTSAAPRRPAAAGRAACPTTTMFTATSAVVGDRPQRVDRQLGAVRPAPRRPRARPRGRGRTSGRAGTARARRAASRDRRGERGVVARRPARSAGPVAGRPHGSPFWITLRRRHVPATLDAATTPRRHASAASRARRARSPGRARRRRPGAAGRCTASRCGRSRRRSSRRRRARRRARRPRAQSCIVAA